MKNAQRRAAWTEICMMEYRISGNMSKATRCADYLIKVIEDETLSEAAEKIRANIKDPNPLASVFSPTTFAGTAAANLIDPEVQG